MPKRTKEQLPPYLTSKEQQKNEFKILKEKRKTLYAEINVLNKKLAAASSFIAILDIRQEISAKQYSIEVIDNKLNGKWKNTEYATVYSPPKNI